MTNEVAKRYLEKVDAEAKLIMIGNFIFSKEFLSSYCAEGWSPDLPPIELDKDNEA